MLIKDGFLFFWKTAEIYSQWHPSVFVDTLWDKGATYGYTRYTTAEQYMMAEKARLFNDEEVLDKILSEDDPRKLKALGRQVKNYDNLIWIENRYNIVRKGNFLKFSQNERLRDELLKTDNLTLVEASPDDTIWGIGMAEDHPDITNSGKWMGHNLLGIALGDVRGGLRLRTGY